MACRIMERGDTLASIPLIREGHHVEPVNYEHRFGRRHPAYRASRVLACNLPGASMAAQDGSMKQVISALPLPKATPSGCSQATVAAPGDRPGRRSDRAGPGGGGERVQGAGGTSHRQSRDRAARSEGDDGERQGHPADHRPRRHKARARGRYAEGNVWRRVARQHADPGFPFTRPTCRSRSRRSPYGGQCD